MHKVKVYLIQWEPPNPASNGQVGTSFTKLETNYSPEIASFVQHVAAASGSFGNVYSTDVLYGESGSPGEYNAEYGGSFKDEDPYPERKLSTCPLPTIAEKAYPAAGEPCISDGETGTEEKNYQLSEELFKFLQAHPTLPFGLGAIYFILTPHGVNSCSGFEGEVAACNTNRYCAYHGAFGIEISKVVHPVIYANMPYDNVAGCETPDQPNKNSADDEINTLSHEDNEAITDPLGEGWYDYQGNEIADKCTYPFFNPIEDGSPSTDAYGLLLGGTPQSSPPTPGTAYNQVIDGGYYLLQREWSNIAGGCVTQAPEPKATFTAYSSPATVGSTVSFNGSASSPSAGTITSYHWDFGDGASAEGREVTHVYSSPGFFTVKLTVTNDSLASASESKTITIDEAVPEKEREKEVKTVAQVTTVTTAATTTTPIRLPSEVVTTSSTPTSLRAWTASQIAGLIGLPANGAKLPGLGTISLGHAQCPPACGVTLKLTTAVASGKGRHRKVTIKQIGSVRVTIADNGSGALALQLNATSRSMLRKSHSLTAKLSVTVQGQEGGIWPIERTLRLTSSASAARRSKHRR